MEAQAAGKKTLSTNSYTIGHLISRDGTSIGYRQYGQGPGLVLVQGAMGSAENFAQLAESLADKFTVYVPDRRGRGLSAQPATQDYNIQKEVEDLEALLMKTATHYVFGLSSGALISLQSSLTLPAIHKVALFEPVFFHKGLPMALLARFQKQIDQNNLAGALITGMKAARLGPPMLHIMPDFLLERLTKTIIAQEKKHGSGAYLPMEVLALTLQNDFRLVAEMDGSPERFRTIKPEALLLGGSKSPAYLKTALDDLEKIVPGVTRYEFAGLDHGAAWNRDKQRNPNGQPIVVAEVLRQFFLKA